MSYNTKVLNKLAEDVIPFTLAARRYLHENPELGNQEFNTTAYIKDKLTEFGFDEIHTGIAGGKTGVIGILSCSKTGPTIGLRADIDALPIKEETPLSFASNKTAIVFGKEVPVMHACGHDCHTAMLLSVASIFSTHRELFCGKLVFIFQPCEEGAAPDWKGPSGARAVVECCKAYSDNKPDVILGIHMAVNKYSHLTPKNQLNGYMPIAVGQTDYGMNQFKITVTGKSGHANNPSTSVDALLAASQIVVSLQSLISKNVNNRTNQASVSIGKFESGTAFNVIADTACIYGALRLTDISQKSYLEKRIETISTNTAEAFGATASVEWTGFIPPLYNDPKICDIVESGLSKIDPDLVERIEGLGYICGLDDFSIYTSNTPGYFLWLGSVPDELYPYPVGGPHTSTYYVNENSLEFGVKAWLYMVCEYIDTIN